MRAGKIKLHPNGPTKNLIGFRAFAKLRTMSNSVVMTAFHFPPFVRPYLRLHGIIQFPLNGIFVKF